MMIILKYVDEGKSLLESATRRVLYDKILISNIPIREFPLFDITTEADNGGILRKRVGEFGIKLSLLQPEKSLKNLSIRDFLRDTSKAFKFFFAMKVADGTEFIGIFKLDDVSADFNYSDNSASIQFIVRSCEEELKLFLESQHSDFSGIGESTNLTFEDYMTNYHLSGLNLELPAQTFAQKCGDPTIKFRGWPYRFITRPNYTIWNKHTRWQTFEDLYRGLGFDYELKLKNSIQETYNQAQGVGLKDLLKIRIFWQIDIINSPAITLTRVLSHSEDILPRATKKTIFMSYQESVYEPPDYIVNRQIVSGNMTGIRGVIMSSDNVVKECHATDGYTGTSEQAWIVYFPFFMRSAGNFLNPNTFPESEYTLYISSFAGFAALPPINDPPFDMNNAYLYEEIFQIPLSQYSSPGVNGFHKPGVVAYPRFFEPDDGNFGKIMTFAISNYKRYLSSGNKKRKYLTARLSDVPGINIYKKINIPSEGLKNTTVSYYVSKITELDLPNQRISFEITEI